MTLLIDIVILLLDVELAEEVEGDDGVDVHDDGQQQQRQAKLQRERDDNSDRPSASAQRQRTQATYDRHFIVWKRIANEA